MEIILVHVLFLLNILPLRYDFSYCEGLSALHANVHAHLDMRLHRRNQPMVMPFTCFWRVHQRPNHAKILLILLVFHHVGIPGHELHEESPLAFCARWLDWWWWQGGNKILENSDEWVTFGCQGEFGIDFEELDSKVLEQCLHLYIGERFCCCSGERGMVLPQVREHMVPRLTGIITCANICVACQSILYWNAFDGRASGSGMSDVV
jgi:hypothetical protein